ncbi:MAG TPA: ectoine/hydroxyectoine ABC transporter permease subunit EhuD [Acidimicrobiales bacterium]
MIGVLVAVSSSVTVLAGRDPRDFDAPAPGAWDWGFAIDIVPFMVEGLVVTIQATLLGITIALVLGLVLAILRRSPRRLISWPVATFIEVIRSTPLLIQLFFLFFVLPDVTDGSIQFSPLTTGVIGLAIHYGTYTSESYRAGIENVATGQWEGATAINLSTTQTWRHVVLPQAVPTVIPALGNYVVAMFKDAPLLTAITVGELLAQAKALQGVWFRGMEPFTVAGVLFLVVSIPAAIGVRHLETRYGYERE